MLVKTVDKNKIINELKKNKTKVNSSILNLIYAQERSYKRLELILFKAKEKIKYQSLYIKELEDLFDKYSPLWLEEIKNGK